MTPAEPAPLIPRARVVDLFAGPGGLDVAATWLGIPVVGIEWDASACATRERAGLKTIQGDVRDHGPGEFPTATVLTGGPPCQTYTVAGSGAGRRALEQVLDFVARMAAGEDVAAEVAGLDDERTGLVLQPLKWALMAHRGGKPYEAIVLEQVPAVLPVWEAIGGVLEGIGYRTAVGILNAEEFGVPQTRKRAILLAHRGHTPALPRPTHRRFRKPEQSHGDNTTLLPCRTLGETLKRGGPFTVISNYGTGGDPKARGRRSSEHPAFTVTGKISRNRIISAEGKELPRFNLSEAGRLQTFPWDYPWAGKDISQQIGNAIPPRLAAHVLAAVLGQELSPGFMDEVVEQHWLSPDAPNILTDAPGTTDTCRLPETVGTEALGPPHVVVRFDTRPPKADGGGTGSGTLSA